MAKPLFMLLAGLLSTIPAHMINAQEPQKPGPETAENAQNCTKQLQASGDVAAYKQCMADYVEKIKECRKYLSSSGDLTAFNKCTSEPPRSNISSLSTGTSAPSNEDYLTPEEVDSAMQGAAKSQAVNGLSGNLTISTRQFWLGVQSAQAKKQYLSFTPQKEDTLRGIFVIFDDSKNVSDIIASRQSCSSVTRIALISSKSDPVAIEAFRKGTLSSLFQNGFGPTLACQGFWAFFLEKDVKHAQAAASDGNFFIGLFGVLNHQWIGYNSGRILYQIRKGDLKKLGLGAPVPGPG